MAPENSNRNQHIAYGSVIVAITASLLFLGYYQTEQIQDDYNSQISSLEERIAQLTDELEVELSDKQDQLNSLTKDLSQSEKNIKNLQDTTEELEQESGEQKAKLGELDQEISDLAVESESFSGIIEDVIDSVVSVHTNRGQGSGAIVTREGLVVTNYHVIQGASSIYVKTYEGDSHTVTLEGYSSKNDIALLRIEANETFQRFRFGDSDNLKAGQKVVALGNPARLAFTATEGIISSPERKAADGLYYIQTDTTLNPGNSGGPLINSQGELIGIIDFKVAGYEELGFAIPSNRVDEVIEKIQEF